MQDRTRDSDEEDAHDRDYDVAVLANNLSQAFRYTMYDNDDTEEVIILQEIKDIVHFWPLPCTNNPLPPTVNRGKNFPSRKT